VRDSAFHVHSLLNLERFATEEQRISVWRQALAAVAFAAEQHAVPLEGLDSKRLETNVGLALQLGYMDSLDWISDAAAALGLYELMQALPAGTVRQAVSQRVFQRLLSLHAEGFCAVVTRLAANAPLTLRDPALHARVALAMEMPPTLCIRADSLALTLIAQTQLSRDWIEVPSTGSLPSRVLAARILERGAREALRRFNQGDRSAPSVFNRDAVKSAWSRLLADRESLVWRRLACARGLLAQTTASYLEEIETDLDTSGSISTWRRGATSLISAVKNASDPRLRKCHGLLESDIVQKDIGVLASMVHGMKYLLDIEPEIAEELLVSLIEEGDFTTVEGLTELIRERFDLSFGAKAAKLARQHLRSALEKQREVDDGFVALIHCLDLELQETARLNTLHRRLAEGLKLYAQVDAMAAYKQALNVISAADGVTTLLENSEDGEAKRRRQSAMALWQLDITLMESARLRNLLRLDVQADTALHTPMGLLESLYARLSEWLIDHESPAILHGEHVEHRTLRLRRLRTWLHFVDADGAYGLSVDTLVYDRQVSGARMLLKRVCLDSASPLRRTLCASTARAYDALVRHDNCTLSDAVLCMAMHINDSSDLQAFSEASMIPELTRSYTALAALAQCNIRAGTKPELFKAFDFLEQLADTLPHGGASRVEALRDNLRLCTRVLEELYRVRGLDVLSHSEGQSLLISLSAAVQQLATLVMGAQIRVGIGPEKTSMGAQNAMELWERSIDRLLTYGEDTRRACFDAVVNVLHEELPFSWAELICVILERLVYCPLKTPTRVRRSSIEIQRSVERPLPDWFPPGRCLGGYYVLYTLGTGGGGSVFAAKRREEKDRSDAELFALKVPEYNGASARTLSEEEFQQLFREEAGALLALPNHANLAKLVTFDAGTRPKPILVMELVEGPSLARLIDMRQMTGRSALSTLLGVGAALETMHMRQIGHLDIKPSNIILRADQNDSRRLTPVLVDFGLSGRKIRAGCATSAYGAPEIWGALPDVDDYHPAAADVYAFCCLIFETFTGQALFDGPNEYAVVSSHLLHDGDPPRLKALAKMRHLRPLAELLARGLRRMPKHRAPISEITIGLENLSPLLLPLPWPLLDTKASIFPSVIPSREATLI